ncbi:hypothetical protein M0R45_035520 [Rubus argutus]|uniref:Uncharacterized protein n=1 Tax=Rubus argutus TaxID=59490 RepID=A0AAW1VVX3_RUBAR
MPAHILFSHLQFKATSNAAHLRHRFNSALPCNNSRLWSKQEQLVIERLGNAVWWRLCEQRKIQENFSAIEAGAVVWCWAREAS